VEAHGVSVDEVVTVYLKKTEINRRISEDGKRQNEQP
jgi:hypothetical protein